MQLFYTAPNARIGDVIPFYDEGSFKPFYLKNWFPDYKGKDRVDGWHMLTTKEHLTFEEIPTLVRGGTGSVIKVGTIYHMFYCTFEHNPERQYIRHAWSNDLKKWKDIPEHKFTSDGSIYALTDWRDPFVFRNEEEALWWMLVAARENEKTERTGCIALCVSKDLNTWEIRKPLYHSGIHQSALECPDLFQIGDWYYLIYSSYTDGFQTYYRMSKSLYGPWIKPKVDTFDTRAFYAAKTGTDGTQRYIYGWNPTRHNNMWNINPQTDIGDDYNTWDWGGALEVHQLVQREDKTLGVKVIDAVDHALKNQVEIKLLPLRGSWKVGADEASVNSPYGYASLIGNQIPKLCKIEMEVAYTDENLRFGFALQVDDKFSEGYHLCFEPLYNRIQMRSGLRMFEEGGKMFPYAVEMERPIPLEEGKYYKIKIFIQESVLVVYVNDEVALSSRMFNYKDRQFGLFTSDGTASFRNIKMFME